MASVLNTGKLLNGPSTVSFSDSALQCRTKKGPTATETKCGSQTKELSIFHQNVCSIQNKKHILENLLRHFNFEIVCLTEHWLIHNQLDYCHFDGYYLASYYYRNISKGGGVCMYIQNAIKSKIIDLSDLCIDKIIECCCVSISSINTSIVVVYRPPGLNHFELFLNNFESILQKVLSVQKYVMLCGDFNIDFNDENSVNNKFFNLLRQYGIHRTIFTSTRISKTSDTCIDNILTNIRPTPSIFLSETIETGISDHLAQRVIIKTGGIEPKLNNNTITHLLKRSFKPNTIENFCHEIVQESWEEIYNTSDPNTAYNLFISTFKLYFNKYFPLKWTSFNNKNKYSPLIKNDLVSGLETLKTLKKDISLNKNVFTLEKLKNFKKQLNNSVLHAKKTYIENILMSASNKSKAMWDIINKEIKCLHKQDNIILTENNNTITDNIQVANKFNKFFTEIASSLINGSAVTANTGFQSILPNTPTNNHSMYLKPVNEDEIAQIIKEMKNKKSVGLDEIPISVIKVCANLINKPLAHIFNKCLEYGVFPDRLKIAKIIPLHKGGDTTCINNYRPIAILPNFSKILEKIILKRLLSFLNFYNIISTNQYGFVKGKSTEQALFTLLNSVYFHLDNKVPVACILADLSKAFDCVNHTILLEKLNKYGIRGIANNLIKSYLSNRLQITSIKNLSKSTITHSMSELLKINIGVPQGSILGPILFLVFINDLPLFLDHGNTIMFADDTSIIVTGQNSQQLIENTSLTINQMQTWFTSNKLVLNIKKSSILYFSLKTTSDTIVKINSNNKALKAVKTAKLLGLHLDENLRWNNQISVLCRKLSSFCFAIKSIKTVSTNKAVLAMYYANIYSILKYGVIFWGNSSNWRKVFIIQKRIIRIIYNLNKADSCRPVFMKQRLLTLPAIYIYSIILYVVQNIQYEKNCEIHNHFTRSANMYHITFIQKI